MHPTQRNEWKRQPNTTQKRGRIWWQTEKRNRPVDNWEAGRRDGRRINREQNHKATVLKREQEIGRNLRWEGANKGKQRRKNYEMTSGRSTGMCRDLVRKLNEVTRELAELLESSF